MWTFSIKTTLSIIFFIALILTSLLYTVGLANHDVTADTIEIIELFLLTLSTILIIASLYSYIPKITLIILGCCAFIALSAFILIETYHTPVNANIISIIRETNYGEIGALLRGIPATVVFTYIFIVFMVIFSIQNRFNLKKQISHRILFINILFCTAIIYSNWPPSQKPSTNISDNIEYFSYSNLDKNEFIRKSLPIAIPFILKDFYYQRKELIQYANTYADYRFNIAEIPSFDTRQIYVLVIGESARFDHWGINGYARNTSPLLSARKDIISFQQMYAYEALTRYSVPVIMSRKPIDNLDDHFHEASIITLFKNTGFKTAWISMQPEFGKYDSPISVYAYEADSMHFINSASFNFKTLPDYKSLPYIKQLIDSTQDNLFIVVHTLGSHQRYKDRYEAHMGIFLPDLLPDGQVPNAYSKQDREIFVNAYDNSIIATDYFLGHLIELLDKKNASSFMFYVSDHGEGLFDDGRLAIGHVSKTFATLHVPAFFWASEEYKKNSINLVHQLTRNSTQLTSIDMVFETLVSLSQTSLNDPRPALDMTQPIIQLLPAASQQLKDKRIISP